MRARQLWINSLSDQSIHHQCRLIQWARRARAQGPQASGGPQTADALYLLHTVYLTYCILQYFSWNKRNSTNMYTVILSDIDFHDIVRSFAENKSRKKYF